jgi:tight adherence protein C
MYESLTPILAFIGVLTLGGGVILGLAARRGSLRRLKADRTNTELDAPQEAQRTGPRALLAGITRLGHALSLGRVSANLCEHLARAGFHQSSAATTYLGVKLMLLLFGGAVAAAFVLPTSLNPWYKGYLLGLGPILLFFLPNLAIRFRRRRRALQVRQHLPVAIDLLEVCVTAGMGLDTAWNAVSDEIRHVSMLLADEMMLVNLERQLGASRTLAMRNMAERTGAEELSSLVALLVQTERFGTSVGEALRTFAQSMREARSMRSEEAAEKLAVKLLFPLVFFIFPVMLLVMGGPAGITIYDVMIRK